ncbi:MAG TPA: hypothetical protein PLU71_05045 [Candidatus Dependentiae bacterium]|nr:hypothetical protein [Candidatus Dependentiae bacterium]HRQ63202.1 hypothetical protein [Candidatus Dependentiae bacterium]
MFKLFLKTTIAFSVLIGSTASILADNNPSASYKKANNQRKNKKSRKPTVVKSWQRLLTLKWGKLSSDDAWNILIPSAVVIGAYVVLKDLSNINNYTAHKTNINPSHNPATPTPSRNIRPVAQANIAVNNTPPAPIGRPLVSNDQADYIRIKSNCTAILQQFASGSLRSSGWHHSIYQYLISENSPAARRVLEEWIRGDHGIKLADYRKSYGIV